ncbi:methyl-accepting chemotaxis protein [Paenibacillus sp. GYB003]|uniref:methyl-accepting chemotaxis protein n=1 Tax=Paenibacillus sp. GYB003 TaxID=2994392 RepID=UPI002F96A128
MVCIIWGMLALGIVVDLLTGAARDSVVVLLVVGTATCGVATMLTWKRWLADYVMYMIASIVTGLTLLLIWSGPVITTYFLVFVNLAIMTLYTHFRAIVFSALLGAGLTTYIWVSPYKEAVFGDNDPVTMYMYLAFIAVPLLVSALFSERLQREVAAKREAAVAEQAKSEAIVDRLSASLTLLNDFSSKLRENVTSTSAISKEVTASFAELSASAETQADSVAAIGESVRIVERAVADLADRTTAMQSLSAGSTRLTDDGGAIAKSLEEQMRRVHETIDRSVALMNELNEQNDRIVDIVSTIRHISEQTHLLSLNAAIEAARAGEYGKGFVVVSSEIRKLAETSQQSTEQIVAILETIRTKTDQAAEQIALGQRTVAQSAVAVKQVADALTALAGNAKTVEHQSGQVKRSADDLHAQYVNIAGEMETIAGLTEQNSAAVQEMAASMTTQDGRIREIEGSFLELDKLAAELRTMTERR